MRPTLQTSVTVWGRLHAVRGFSVFVVLVLAAPILISVTAREAYLRTERPDVGLEVDAELGVEARDGRWTGVQQRDRIVELDGVALKDPQDWVSRALDGGPRPLAVTFVRGGERFTVVAESRPLAGIDRLAVFARVATAAVLMIMGLLVFVARPGAAVTWLMLALTWDLGAFLLVKIGFWTDPRLMKEVSMFPWALATSLGLHVLTYFPARIAWFARRRWGTLVLYAPVVATPFIQLFHGVTRFAGIGSAITAAAMVFVVWVVATQHRRVRRSADARSRSQYRALLVGFALGLGVPAAWNWLRISLDVWNSPWAAHYNALPLVLFAGVTANAIVRHNALEIDRFTAAVVGYALTTVLVGGAFAVALVGVPLLLGTSGLAESPSLLVLTTALTFTSFTPVYRLIKRWVDRRFFREHAGASQMAKALHDLVLGMQGTREDAFSAAFASAAILSGERVDVWLLDVELKELRLHRRDGSDGESASIASSGALGLALASGASGGVDDLAPRALDPAAQDELRERELAMVAPIMLRGAVAGFVAIGRKRSGAGYTPEELGLLTIIGAQLGGVLERTDDKQIDRYHLEKRLGTGGMAEVFLAWQLGPGGFERKVALKRPLPHVSEDPNAVAAFLDEARLAAQLVHPHIARVYDVGERAGSYFIVMEYVDGPSLRQVLRELGQREVIMPVAIATSIMIDVLAALDHAHNARDERHRRLELVHRDVSPRNILMNRLGQPKLVDFGIARAQFQLHVTRTGIIKGTLPYMSPEQASDYPLDHRADLYSAAVVLYELLTNRAAYPNGPHTRNQPNPRPAPASTIVPAVPAALDRVLRRATEAVPHKRFASAAELSTAIREAIAPITPGTAEDVVAFLHEAIPDALGIDRPPSEGGSDPSGPQTVVEVPAGRVPEHN